MAIASIRTWIAVLAIGCSTAVVSCAFEVANDDTVEVAALAQGLYGNLSPGFTYWNGQPLGGTPGLSATIPVCWTPSAKAGKIDPEANWNPGTGAVADPMRNAPVPAPYQGFNTIKGWVRLALENSWGRAANLRFTGWDDTCATNFATGSPGKLMFTFSRMDENRGLGKSTTLGTKSFINATKPNQASYDEYTLHEVGHALGFAHEAERPDNYANGLPTTCLQPAGQWDGGVYLNRTNGGATFVDKDSTMCYDSRATRLSAGDVMGAQRVYGRKPAGSIVGYGGRCTKIQNDSLTNGTPIVSAACGSTWSSFWLSWFNQLVASPDGQSVKSWAVQGAVLSPTAPTPLVASDFGFAAHQVFTLSNMRWHAVGNMCVTAESALANARLAIQPCDGRANQRWTFWDSNVRVKLQNTNLCVAAQRSPAVVGDELRLAVCADVATQNFDFSRPHQARDPASQLCFNVRDGLPAAGKRLRMSNGCDDNPAQPGELFHMSGRIVSAPLAWTFVGQCAAWAGDVIGDGTAAQVRVCGAAPPPQTLPDGRVWTPTDPMEWDLYWP